MSDLFKLSTSLAGSALRAPGIAALAYRTSAHWSFAGAQSPHLTRFSVIDPNRAKSPGSAQAALSAAQRLGVPVSELRTVLVHPDDRAPRKGSRIAWDGGTLEILEWRQRSEFTGQHEALAVIVR